MPITRIKICGITRPDDALVAADLGAHAIGINLYRGPRKVTVDIATAITIQLPLFVSPVILASFQQRDTLYDQDTEFTLAICHPIYQMYGIPGAHSNDYDLDRWIVVHVDSPNSLRQLSTFITQLSWKPRAILLDTASEKSGGTGQTFNWNWIAEARAAGELDGLPPIILAGGLTPDNVADAIRIAKPYAVDVSSGVEIKGQPGIKDPLKLRDFIQAVNGADRQESEKP